MKKESQGAKSKTMDVAHSTGSGQALRKRAEKIAMGKAAKSPVSFATMSLEESMKTLSELRVSGRCWEATDE